MKKGFTLIELVIVVAILAVLASVIILVLNPVQLMAQARDSQRISDLRSVKVAVALYLSTATSTITIGTGPYCTASGCTSNGPFGSETMTTSTAVDSTGWVPIDLTKAIGGSPLPSLPLDPTNSSTYFYAYKGENTDHTFELDGRMESQKYRDLMKTDGGDKNTCSTYTESTCYYEIGTHPGLDI